LRKGATFFCKRVDWVPVSFPFNANKTLNLVGAFFPSCDTQFGDVLDHARQGLQGSFLVPPLSLKSQIGQDQKGRGGTGKISIF
jgi:hypothetical protein